MLQPDVKLISVDDHVVEPKDLWERRLPAKYKEDGPRIVKDGDGVEGWHMEGVRYPINLHGNAVARKFHSTEDGTGEEYYVRTYDDLVPACYDPAERVKSMDIDGVWAQLLFPTFPRFSGTQFLNVKDKDLGRAIVEAYNDWMIQDWCAAAPDRFIPLIIVPLWDAQAAADEIRRMADQGAKAVSFPESTPPHNLPSFWTTYWDPMFTALEETGLPLCMHIGTSGSLPKPSPETLDVVGHSLVGINSMTASADLIFSGALDRHPNLKIALSEGGASWAPYLMDRMDYTWEKTRFKVSREQKPSELFHRHFWTCFISDEPALQMRDLIGIDRLMWEGDYPHNDCNWPNARKVAAQTMQDLPDQDAKQIGETNARQLFNFWD